MGCAQVAADLVGSDDAIWKMMGLPLEQQGDVLFGELRIVTNSGECADADGCTPAEADSAGVMHNIVYHYNPDNPPTFYDVTTDGDTLNRWEGHWVAFYPNAAALEPVVLFPELRVAELSISGSAIHTFPPVAIGTESETFTVSNNGDALATLSIEDNILSDLPIIMDQEESSCQASLTVLAPRESCNMKISFVLPFFNLFITEYQKTMAIVYDSIYGPDRVRIRKNFRGSSL